MPETDFSAVQPILHQSQVRFQSPKSFFTAQIDCKEKFLLDEADHEHIPVCLNCYVLICNELTTLL